MASGLARALGDATLADEPTGDYKPGAILVTGGAGFIASHVVIRLVEGGHKVRGRGRGRGGGGVFFFGLGGGGEGGGGRG